eukprot:CAMPEP_0178439060 /NCGR_PEP_ID=MMETSP0689_2-20121128/35946_1 /TAXON_ID=160604 /ORGANISM="Amphidinium massartii, Strain CS-259" /LENGTH=523 /DNA_ID=CAMNT_0020061547 /DNA_START=210 /DNA_END=1777 /DNA_ORIENTATION=-
MVAIDAQALVAEDDLAELEDSFFDCFTLGKKLGAGAYAQVRLAFEKRPHDSDSLHHPHQRPKCFAVKIQDLREDTTSLENGELDLETDEVKLEARLWQRAMQSNSQHIVKLHAVFWEMPGVFMVMERCFRTVLEELRQQQNLTQTCLGSIFYQMALGLQAIHGAGVIHRDVKPQNFLVSTEGCVKLGDFGLAAAKPSGGLLREVCGTVSFMSPEMLKEQGYNEKTDIWSLGVFMYAVVYGHFPYTPKSYDATPSEVKNSIRDAIGKRSPSFEPPSNGSRPASSLERMVRFSLQRDAARRPVAEQLLHDSFWVDLEEAQQGAVTPQLLELREISLKPSLMAAIKAGVFGESLPWESKALSHRNHTDLALEKLAHKKSGGKSGIPMDHQPTNRSIPMERQPTKLLSEMLSRLPLSRAVSKSNSHHPESPAPRSRSASKSPVPTSRAASKCSTRTNSTAPSPLTSPRSAPVPGEATAGRGRVISRSALKAPKDSAPARDERIISSKAAKRQSAGTGLGVLKFDWAG